MYRIIKTYKNFINESLSDRYKNILDKVYSAKVGDILPNEVIYQYVQSLTDEVGKYTECFVDGNLGDRLDEYDNYILKEIPIDDLDLDEWTLNEFEVDKYSDLYLKTNKYPPIVVDENYNIIDGLHRTNSLYKNGLTKILAFVGI